MTRKTLRREPVQERAQQRLARLLDAADELDGVTPLVFMPTGPSASHPIEGLS